MYIDYSYLRPRKAEVLKFWHEPISVRDDLKVYRYNNATILPLRRISGDDLLFGRGGVIDSEHKYVDVSAIDKRVQFAYETDIAEMRDEIVVYCGYLVPQWGHFLIEATARLWVVFREEANIDKYVFFIRENEDRNLSGNYREFFELLGILDKIEIINRPIQYKTVLIPELGYCWKTYYSNEYKQIFERISQNVCVGRDYYGASKKLFLSRSQLKDINKREFGLEMLDDFFSSNGYEIVFPEKISLSELICKIDCAEEIAALSGTLPHNLLFSRDQKNLVIIERNVLNNEIQADINMIKNLNVTYVDANIPLYSIDLGNGPFILAYNRYFKKYSDDRDLIPPRDFYLSPKYLKRLLAKYIKAYQHMYHYEWVMADWAIKYTDYVREGYNDGMRYYKDYLTGRKPFLFHHYLMPHYWKMLAKCLIKKIR